MWQSVQCSIECNVCAGWELKSLQSTARSFSWINLWHRTATLLIITVTLGSVSRYCWQRPTSLPEVFVRCQCSIAQVDINRWLLEAWQTAATLAAMLTVPSCERCVDLHVNVIDVNILSTGHFRRVVSPPHTCTYMGLSWTVRRRCYWRTIPPWPRRLFHNKYQTIIAKNYWHNC